MTAPAGSMVRPDDQRPKVGPHWPTVADMLAVTGGVAFWIWLLPDRSGGWPPGFSLPNWFVLVIIAESILGAVVFGTAFATLIRRVEYGGMPRPAEWLALLFVAVRVREAMPGIDDVVNWIQRTTASSAEFGLWRWRLAGASLFICFGLLAALTLINRWLPAWLKTTLLTAVASVLSWGPLSVIAREFPWLIPSPWEAEDGWPFWGFLELFKGVARLPEDMLFAVPALAAAMTWRYRHTRPWIWTESISAAATALVGVAWSADYYLPFTWSPNWICERAIRTIGLLVVFAASRLIVTRLAAAWHRWLGEPIRQFAESPLRSSA